MRMTSARRRMSAGRARALATALVFMLAGPANGQVLGPVGLPALPTGPVTGALGESLGEADRLAATAGATGQRVLRLRELVRANPRFIDLDDAGQAVVRGEMVTLS